MPFLFSTLPTKTIFKPLLKLYRNNEGQIYVKDKKTKEHFYIYNLHFQNRFILYLGIYYLHLIEIVAV